ncbi:hypothetical protein Golax_005346 [Gossypium laxum]|uniref:DUF7745 domain-containing protein n=2 Tax=Gossypium laxum TaxID=34288 RepID=A0A7J9A0D9_9ROSI|nr:hypothetical protein [Gossypium laxum]
MPKKGVNLESNDKIVVPLPIRKKIDALNWIYFWDARSLPNEELVQGFYASLTKLGATEVLVCKKKAPLTSKSINDFFDLLDVEEYEYFSMMKNINWDFLQQVLNVVTNLGSQWIIRKYGSCSCRREYLKPFAKKGLSMLGRSFSRKSMIVPEKRPENVHELSLPELRELNRKDELKGIWKSWDEAKKTHFSDKYGDVAQLLFVKLDDALLKAMVHFWDPTYKCFTFNEVDMNVNFWGLLANLMGLPVDTVKVRLKDKNSPYISWSNIRDVMGKANSDRHLELFAFTVYGLIVFPKALGYMSVELANFLFQIEKRVNSAPTVLVETIILVNFIRRKGDECFLGCTQLLFVWMKSHFRCLYKRFRQVFVPSTRPIEEFLESEWTLNQSIDEWSFVGSLNGHIGSHQLFLVDGSEPIRQHQAYVKEKEEEIMRQQQQHRSDMKGREEELRIQLERCQLARSDLFTQIQKLEVDQSLRAIELQKA